MKLKELLKGVEVLEVHAELDRPIGSVVCDHRQAADGSLFVAVKGFAHDGNSFIAPALERGAAVVVTARPPAGTVPYILVADDRQALARIGRNFYGDPAKSMIMVGVTGTNGKTSVTWLLKQVLEQVTGEKVGLIGTIEIRIGEEQVATDRTTPESLELQELLARMRDGGCRYVVMEVSSHAIALERVEGIRFDVAAFTNLTEDHLDFHKTMEDYCDTKARIFRQCGRAVINRDDQWADRICAQVACPVIGTSAREATDLYARGIRLEPEGVRFTAVAGQERTPVRLLIPGRFTVYNALTVLGAVKALGLPLGPAAQVLAQVRGVKGRAEVVPTPGTGFTVVIDYAHTPDALENVLRTMRGACRGRLICVFGCGGDRDPIKRPIMGRIGVELSDLAVISSDNPRDEDPAAIIRDILAGVEPGMGAYKIIEDRRKAIRFAMDIGEKNDIIILAGKGHENYQQIRGVKHPLDEREEVARWLMEKR